MVLGAATAYAVRPVTTEERANAAEPPANAPSAVPPGAAPPPSAPTASAPPVPSAVPSVPPGSAEAPPAAPDLAEMAQRAAELEERVELLARAQQDLWDNQRQLIQLTTGQTDVGPVLQEQIAAILRSQELLEAELVRMERTQAELGASLQLSWEMLSALRNNVVQVYTALAGQVLVNLPQPNIPPLPPAQLLAPSVPVTSFPETTIEPPPTTPAPVTFPETTLTPRGTVPPAPGTIAPAPITTTPTVPSRPPAEPTTPVTPGVPISPDQPGAIDVLR